MSPTWLQRTRSPVLQGRTGHRVARGEGITASVRLILASGARRALSACWTVVVFAVGFLLPLEELGGRGLRFWGCCVLVPAALGTAQWRYAGGCWPVWDLRGGEYEGWGTYRLPKGGTWLREGAGGSAARRPRDGMSPSF